ncbi:hypothetical protein BDN70DRAFT_878811 [Pholiota conissans]|uniref:Uncharacterized protein n=1 Tax=Pholiota conissans TaxID=109636 RepID=A0A9P5Z4Q9_9AGAR|nr:hypothetical protein BDN70DRAFT_878811 [Pholiota conissans]
MFPLPTIRTVEVLVSLLRKAPEIADYTREFHLVFGDIEEMIMPTEFKLFSRLKTFDISFDMGEGRRIGRYYLSFDRLSQQTREVLVHDMPALTTLCLTGIGNFPFHELLEHCPNLLNLELSSIRINQSNVDVVEKRTLPLKPVKLERLCSDGDWHHIRSMQRLLGLRQSDGQPVVDVSGLKHLDFSSFDDIEWTITRTLLLHTNQLTTLILRSRGQGMVPLAGLGTSLVASRATLKTVVISTNGQPNFDEDPLHGLCEELEIFGRQDNVLESLSYSLWIPISAQCGTGSEWAALDQVVDNFA